MEQFLLVDKLEGKKTNNRIFNKKKSIHKLKKKVRIKII